MKTSWSDIELIERYLNGQLAAEELTHFEGRLSNDTVLNANVGAQVKVRQLARQHYLLKLRHQTKALHRRLYNDPSRRSLRQAIEALFKN